MAWTWEDVQNLDFKASPEPETAFRYITVDWAFPITDNNYEIRLMADCGFDHEDPNPLNHFYSESKIGVVDTASPSVIGLPQPAKNLVPGSELKMLFLEDLNCNEP